MTDDIVPSVVMPDEDERARIREQFQNLIKEAETSPEQPAPKRGRGRPRGSTNKAKPSDFEPVYTDPEDRPLPTLETPPLTQRDQREVAKRLAGILSGVTGVASVAKPYFQMTDEEAEAIATPLSTYLLRQEQIGSGFAKQVLEEYDLAAFAIALAAYVVRVYLDFKKERDLIRESNKPRDVTPREPTAKSVSDIRDIGTQSQEGTERPVSRSLASTPESVWTPAGP